MERRKKEMAFTSSIFLFVFFPICLLGFFLAHAVEKVGSVFKKLRLSDLFLVGIGLIFYGWASLDGIFWMVGMIFLVFLLGKLIEKVPQKTPARLLAVLCSVLVVTLALIYFKYTGFLVTTINQIFSFSLSVKSIAAPLGVSFITFSAISYFVDIYRQDAKAGNLLDAALYLSFFPKVISGPIALWKDFSVQICWAYRKLDTENFLWGLNRMILGFAKKVILADVFGLLISQISGNMSGGIDIITAWGMAFLYMLQIYYDFSGYSDIALGLSALFGIRLKENFCFPYLSQSIGEFWRRWHISLGTWFREYIYIPLGGNRKGKNRTFVNLFIVFLVTGIWHGAGWNYILWGIINGVFSVLERMSKNKTWYQKTPAVIKWAVTMSIVLLSWQVFRLSSMSEIGQYFQILFGVVHFDTVNFTWQYYFDLRMVFLMTVGTVGAILPGLSPVQNCWNRISKNKAVFCISQILLLGLGVLAVMFMINSTYSPFIYFQY